MENKKINFEHIIFCILTAWCLSSIFLFFGTGCMASTLDNYSNVNIWMFFMIFATCFFITFFLYSILRKKDKDIQYLLLPIAFAVYSIITLLETKNIWYCLVLILFWIFLIRYYTQNNLLKFKKEFTKKKSIILIIIGALAFIVIVGGIVVIRYAVYFTPNFDFGIFAQMFYNMKHHFWPVTTCERDYLLSHFAIHLSPILYTILPIYCIFESPVTIQIMQPIILVSSVIPMILICKHYKFSYRKITIFAFLLILYPAVTTGTNYDFHENCFLLPLLLWLFYLFEKQKNGLTILFAILTMLVKEDAAIYIFFFGIYALIGRKRRKYWYDINFAFMLLLLNSNASTFEIWRRSYDI